MSIPEKSTSGKPVEVVLARLENPKRSGTGWSARCPAHDDRTPSLSVAEGDDGRVLVHCHAGCAPEAIVEAWGLQMSDLMPSIASTSTHISESREKQQLCRHDNGNRAHKTYPTANAAVAYLERQYGEKSYVWAYKNAEGEPVGLIVRWDRPDGKKDIRPVSRNGQGWTTGGMPEPRPLYQLPDLAGARRIYVVEGEKAADAARSIGLTATTSPHGSKSAGKAGWAPLAGKEIVILPDADDAGTKYADGVTSILANLKPAPTIKRVELPGLAEGGDIFDWLDSRDAVEPEELRQQIEAMAKAAPAYKSKEVKPRIKCFEPFPVDTLPNPVRGFVLAGAAAHRCDPTFIALPLMASLAATIGATRRIRLKATWSEPAVVWTAAIAESGTGKSPSQNLALSFINRLQSYKLQELPELEEQYQRDFALFQADMQHWKTKGRTKGEPPPEKPYEPSVERYVVNDTTMEALVDRLKESPRGLLCSVDELSQWFGSFNSYRGGRGGDVAKWLSIHRAEHVIQDRRTGSTNTIYVPFAAVSLCGGIQPETLKTVLGKDHIENGLLARLLVARPPRQAKVWTEAVVDGEIVRQMERLFGRLLALQFGLNDNDQPAPIDIPLTPEGKRMWVGFYNVHNAAQSKTDGALASAYSKLEGYAARFALIHHLVRCANDDPSVDPDTIDAVSIKAGATLAQWFANEAERVYSMFDESDNDRHSRQLIEWIEARGGSVTVRETQQGHRKYKTAKDAEEALNELVETDLGKWEIDDHNGGRGRPAVRFVLSIPRAFTASTVYTNSVKPGENCNCVDVDSVDSSGNKNGSPEDDF